MKEGKIRTGSRSAGKGEWKWQVVSRGLKEKDGHSRKLYIFPSLEKRKVTE